MRSADLFPFALSGLAVRLYSRLALAERPRPMFNLVITNVPGPPRRLTIGGAEMLCYVGAAPVFDGLGLILPVLSYAGTVSIGVTADRTILGGAAEFAGDVPWAHLDIAGPMDAESDDGIYAKGATGYGTRLLIDLAVNFRKPA